MANLETEFKARLQTLLVRLGEIVDSEAMIAKAEPVRFAQALALVVATKSLLDKVEKDAGSRYRKIIDETTLDEGSWKAAENNQLVSNGNKAKLALMLSMLSNLKEEIDLNLLGTVENRIRAQIFEGLAGYANRFLKENQKDVAGIIAVVVLEETVHKLCEKASVAHAGKTLDPLADDLVKAGALTQREAKLLKGHADFRNSAAHARWQEFTAAHVRSALDFVQHVLVPKLTE